MALRADRAIEVGLVSDTHLPERLLELPAALFEALRGVDLTIRPGEFVAVMGPSGAGKSTLLHLIAGLDAPTAGEVVVGGQPLASLDDDALTLLRRRRLGIVFQAFNLIDVLTAEENVSIALRARSVAPREAVQRALVALDRVGVGDLADRLISELSGGQMQRVAVARALAAEADVLLADEPTSELDETNRDVVVAELRAEAARGAVVVVATSLGVLFVAGARLRDFALAALIASGVLGALAFSSTYRVERLTAFLDPWGDPFASGFQLTNSLIAIGRGEWLGVGLGASVQKLFYLPEAHTDFVFAVVAEELGFVGSTIVIGLFALLVYRALALGQKALAAGREFQGLLCFGIGLMLGLEAFINIGVNTGLLPTKGLTLPLISYGRSSVVATLGALGLLLRIAWELNVEEQRPKRGGRT